VFRWHSSSLVFGLYDDVPLAVIVCYGGSTESNICLIFSLGVLLANKIDLREENSNSNNPNSGNKSKSNNQYAVSRKEGEELASTLGLQYFECAAVSINTIHPLSNPSLHRIEWHFA
jgi:hypothetical protein